MIGVGMPQAMYLDLFGRIVHDAFGTFPYLVGSATQGKQWRDVDVRLILDDEEYARLIGDIRQEAANPRWQALNMAFAALGKHITGLPIDFQIQQQTDANLKFPKQQRHALILAAGLYQPTASPSSGDPGADDGSTRAVTAKEQETHHE